MPEVCTPSTSQKLVSRLLSEMLEELVAWADPPTQISENEISAAGNSLIVMVWVTESIQPTSDCTNNSTW